MEDKHINDRYLIISRHELWHNKDIKSFVWSCILRFREITAHGIWGDDLVVMWGKDYIALMDNQKEKE